jgi:hypothetical protein
MSERLIAAIEEIEAQIKAKEAELITPLKITINQLCQLIGEPARYAIDGSGATGQPKRNILNWKSDQFFNRPLATCVTEYMDARESAGLERTASIDDIYEALSKGGYKFEGASGNDENTKRAIKISLTKNTAQFAKISENVFGLKKWYGGVRMPTRKPNGKNVPATEEEIEPAVQDGTGVPPNEAKT